MPYKVKKYVVPYQVRRYVTTELPGKVSFQSTCSSILEGYEVSIVSPN